MGEGEGRNGCEVGRGVGRNRFGGDDARARSRQQSLAFSGLVLFAGYGIKRLVPPLTRYNVPAPVVGGLLVAIVITWRVRPAPRS